MRRRRIAAALLLIFLLLSLPLLTPALAAYTPDGRWYPSPDQPQPYYWFRTDLPVPGKAQAMDARLQEISDAFGRGEYQESRRLAESVILSPPQPDSVILSAPQAHEGSTPGVSGLQSRNHLALRAEAASFIIQSHLAQGDFQAARAAAERFGDRDALTRINNLEAQYKAEVGRLQHIVATTKDPQQAARAQLLTAQAHQRVGRLELALQSYWKVIERYPREADAAQAVGQITSIHCPRGDQQGALTACEQILSSAPDSAAAARACQILLDLWVTQPEPPYEQLRERLREIAAAYPGTQAADMAHLGIGKLYLAQGMPELAEQHWAALCVQRPASAVTAQARLALAELRYSQGEQAFLAQDYAAAVPWLERLRPDADMLGPRRAQHAFFILGQSHKYLEHWDQAAELFHLLAGPDSDLAYLALYELGDCYLEAGHYEEALDAFTRYLQRFPQSGLVGDCQYRSSLCQQALARQPGVETQ